MLLIFNRNSIPLVAWVVGDVITVLVCPLVEFESSVWFAIRGVITASVRRVKFEENIGWKLWVESSFVSDKSRRKDLKLFVGEKQLIGVDGRDGKGGFWAFSSVFCEKKGIHEELFTVQNI